MQKGWWQLIRKGIVTGEPEPVNRFLGCEHVVLDAVIPQGSNPAHGAVPKPPPKPKKAPTETDPVKLAQARAASECARRAIDYQRTDKPSGKMVKVRITLYDMR